MGSKMVSDSQLSVFLVSAQIDYPMTSVNTK